MSGKPVLSDDVLAWPEFQGLCLRLGIDLDCPTLALTIRLETDRPVEVQHRYYGKDMAAEVRELLATSSDGEPTTLAKLRLAKPTDDGEVSSAIAADIKADAELRKADAELRKAKTAQDKGMWRQRKADAEPRKYQDETPLE